MFSANSSQVSNASNYIEDVFSTYLYAGNGSSSTRSITTGVDSSTYGSLVWIKNRTVGGTGRNNYLTTTALSNAYLLTNTTDAAVEQSAPYPVDPTSTGFNLNTSGSNVNTNGQDYVSWTFRKQPKFFDVVTYTGNSTARTIPHNLGSVPKVIIIKELNASGWWWSVYYGIADKYLKLNTTDAADTSTDIWNNTQPTSTEFSVGFFNPVNTTGTTYVAYLFAHNAGGFGLTGTDNVISCGSWTGTGSTVSVDLGYEPQWLMFKRTDDVGDWVIVDNMRGFTTTGADAYLKPNTSGAETSVTGAPAVNATGFSWTTGAGTNFIYIAIRRGPMKVPTSGTSVFIPVSATPSGATTVTTNFPVDLAINAQRDASVSGNKVFWDRLRGSSTAAGQGIFSNLTNAEVSYASNGIGLQSNTTIVDNYWNTLNGATTSVIYWNFKRAPSFFDEVCYTGTGSTTTFNHNLGVAPELMIIKSRSDALGWRVYAAPAGNTGYLVLNANDAFGTSSATWNNTSPTSSVFTVGTTGAVNSSGSTFVAYLFASVSGVSKVGSYTGTGATQTINCGFTGGARFVMVKRTDNLGSWWVWDTARGMVSGTDPRLELNTTNAETNANWVYTTSTGFQVVSTNSEVNASGGTYIYLAIA